MKVDTKPFDDQEAGTSGLRKRLAHFQQNNYLENFVQSIFNCIDIEQNPTLVLGGDGRLGNDQACQTILKMAKDNRFKRIIVGQNGILSTPAASHLVRKYKTLGAVILSASHNPAGENGDFGVKFNDATGGPASASLSQKIFECSRAINHYNIDTQVDIDLTKCGVHQLDTMIVEVIDPVHDYCELMQIIFDFSAIQSLFNSGFTLRFDAMHAVTGPYAHALFVNLFGVDRKWILNGDPDPRFNGKHPDPNLTHAKELYQMAMSQEAPDLCVACDGDGDRNLIVGRHQFVSPGDSLAVLCANAHLVPFYKEGLKGVARSMPTSRAVDKVAKTLKIPFYEVPTGWKFPAELLENGKISICGEESFGTGSDHIREKDGIWAIMMWLNIIAKRKMSVSEIMLDHWKTFGRLAYQRHDYEGLKLQDAEKVMVEVRKKGKEFSYTDDDGYTSEQQGVFVVYENGSRLIFRLSGTDTQNSTLRVYLEQPADPDETNPDLGELTKEYCTIACLEKYIGRTTPDVIT